MRSMLFVPADQERKMSKALTTDADALIFDLEDAVLPEAKDAARAALQAFLGAHPDPSRHWVRVNGPESPYLLADLAALGKAPIRGIVLPKIRGPEDLTAVDHYLAMLEALTDRPPGSIRLVAVCTETPIAVLRMAEIAQRPLPRLAALMWGGEDLSTALGAATPRTPSGGWLGPYAHARTQCLLAAHALGIGAIDTLWVDLRDVDGCRRSALEARADGFTGKIAIHPAQVAPINEAFTPTADELSRAQRVVAAFAQGAGAVAFEGQMLDIPHLRTARRLLASGRPTGGDTSG